MCVYNVICNGFHYGYDNSVVVMQKLPLLKTCQELMFGFELNAPQTLCQIQKFKSVPKRDEFVNLGKEYI